MKLQEVAASVLRRLDDEEAVVWSNDEIELYIKDGYNKFCRETKCLFDIHVIENVPQVGNWSNDLERYLAEQTPGMGLTDAKLHFTEETERDKSLTGQVGGSVTGPVVGTSPADGIYAETFNLPTKVRTGDLPNSTVDVLRVTWDEYELTPEESADMRRLDVQYERREGGDPRHFTLDKDGLFTLRLIPPALADAVYPTIDGSWGTMTQTSDTAISVVGSYGILREVEGAFPGLGVHGSPTQQHPATKNIAVEIARLGRSLDTHAFEIPASYIKFVIFWAMHRALKSDGPGQDQKLAKHYADRYQMGVQRMESRLKKTQKEHVLKMGSQGETYIPFDMGEPMLPYPYGPKGRNIE
jgi:hypothetical protein